MFNRIEMKAKARELLHKNIFMLGSMAAIPFIIELLGNQFVPQIPQEYYTSLPSDLGVVYIALAKNLGASQLLGVASAVATYFLVVMCMELRRNPEADFNSISKAMSVKGFINYGVKTMLLNIITGLGMMFFVFPGLYLSYRYFFVRYIAIEQPELSIRETFALSKEYSKGIKVSLFVLDLSFTLWIFAQIMLYSIPSLYVTPYIILTIMFVYYDRKREFEKNETYQEDEYSSSDM